MERARSQGQRQLCWNTCSQCSADGRDGCHPEESLRSGTGRQRRDSEEQQYTHTHTRARSSLSFSEMTVIHYRSLTDLLPECSPSVTPADLCQCDTVGRVNPPAARREALLALSEFQHHGQRLACSTTCTFQHFPLFHYLCLCSEKRAFIAIFTLDRLSACLLTGKMVSCNLYLKDYSVYFNWDPILEIVTVTWHNIPLTN